MEPVWSHRPTQGLIRQLALLCLTWLVLLAACQPKSPSPTTQDSPAPGPDSMVVSSMPDEIDPNGRYVFYIHGKIMEDEGVDPVSPQFGRYAFSDILRYLAEAGFYTIGEVRSGPTNVNTYADRVAGQVENLLAEGVPGENISVVGFSKGAYITMLVSSKLKDPALNFTLIAICSEETMASPDIVLAGRILSLYEKSDDYGSSCGPLVERSPGVVEFEEIPFETGKRHGAFYAADPIWLDPIIVWIKEVGG